MFALQSGRDDVPRASGFLISGFFGGVFSALFFNFACFFPSFRFTRKTCAFSFLNGYLNTEKFYPKAERDSLAFSTLKRAQASAAERKARNTT